MSLTPTEVQKIAHLARLTIKENEIQPLTTGLDNILALVKVMNEVDISAVAPMAHPLDAVQLMREDIVTETNQRERFMQIAPQSYMGLFLVPQVIESTE